MIVKAREIVQQIWCLSCMPLTWIQSLAFCVVPENAAGTDH